MSWRPNLTAWLASPRRMPTCSPLSRCAAASSVCGCTAVEPTLHVVVSHQSLRASTKRLQTQVAGLEEMGATRRQALIDAHARTEELEAKLAAAATEHGAERDKMVGAASVQLSTHGSSSSHPPPLCHQPTRRKSTKLRLQQRSATATRPKHRRRP